MGDVRSTGREREDRVLGFFLGVALGDALGLACEGMTAAAIRRRFGAIRRFHMLGRRGFVSDDTEQTVLLATSLLLGGDDVDACVRRFRRSMEGWLVRLPWGIGWATLRACLRMGMGFRESGVCSAGNGAAMRAGPVGVRFCDDADRRQRFGEALARVTHTDRRAVDGALFVAELVAACVSRSSESKEELVCQSLGVVEESRLRGQLKVAMELATSNVEIEKAAEELGTGGYIVESVPFATFCFLISDNDILRSLGRCVEAGGDADTNAAILGGWLGALYGASSLPVELVGLISDGPFGPSHLERLGLAMIAGGDVPGYSFMGAMIRNLLLYPVVLGHGLWRLVRR